MKWRPIKVWHLTVALHRGAVAWVEDPQRNRQVLRSRTGTLYDYTYSRQVGWLIRRRLDGLL